LVFPDFIKDVQYTRVRDDRHKAKFPDYPHPTLILSKNQQYLFRHSALKHLRIEQLIRYFSTTSWIRRGETTQEDTIQHNDESIPCDRRHKHFDEFAERVVCGQKFHSRAVDCDVYMRRKQSRLGVTRTPFLEPLGKKREDFWQSRLFLALPWYCDEPPHVLEDGLEWTFKWDCPVKEIKPRDLKIGPNNIAVFEQEAYRIEKEICSIPGLICECCMSNKCESCLHATSFHICSKANKILWCKGTLFDGQIDYQRALYNLHRRQVPTDILKKKADQFIDEVICYSNGNTFHKTKHIMFY